MEKGRSRGRALTAAIVVFALILLGAFFLYPSLAALSNHTTTQSTTDSSFFLRENQNRVSALVQWFMSPFNLSAQKAGYDPSYGMIRGGYWAGGFQNGFVLIDSQLIAASSLDYLNSVNGVHTEIAGNLTRWLSSTFVNPTTGLVSTYNGDDRREIMFGKQLPCVYQDSGQVYYALNHTLADPVPVTTALPTFCSTDALGPMNVYSLWIELYYLEGNKQAAQTMFMNTVEGWTSTPGTGVGGAAGGYFSSTFDSGNCKNSRTLGYWLEMARATGYWDLSAQTRQVALQAMDELWAHQQPDGGISTNYPSCGGTKESPESTGLALLAFDPRVPGWFGTNGSGTSVGYMVGAGPEPAGSIFGGAGASTAAVGVVNVAAREDGPT